MAGKSFFFFFFFRTYDISVSDRTKNSPGQSQQLPQYGTAVMRAGLTEEQRRRLGLHRPGAVTIFVTLKSLSFFFHLFSKHLTYS